MFFVSSVWSATVWTKERDRVRRGKVFLRFKDSMMRVCNALLALIEEVTLTRMCVKLSSCEASFQ